MSTLSVPLTPELERAIAYLLATGYSSNKADIARKAILKMEEEAAIQAVQESQREIAQGEALEGSLKDYVKDLI